MCKPWTAIIGLLALSTLLTTGCSDEDTCPACPVQGIPGLVAHGGIAIENDYYGYRLSANINFYTLSAVIPQLDSVKIDTFRTDFAYIHGDYSGPVYVASLWKTNPSAYTSGTVIHATAFGRSQSSSCTLPILDALQDECHIVSPPYGALVDTNTTVDVTWRNVENAGWYAVFIDKYWDPSRTGNWIYSPQYAYSTDTTYTISPDNTASNVGHMRFSVNAVCGPTPTLKTGNWSGKLVTGTLYSYGYSTTTQINVDNGMTRGMNLAPYSVKRPEITAEEIVEGVYKTYR